MYRVIHKGWYFIDGNYTVNVQGYPQRMRLHWRKLYCQCTGLFTKDEPSCTEIILSMYRVTYKEWTEIILLMYRVTHKGWDFIYRNYTVNVQGYPQRIRLHGRKLYCHCTGFSTKDEPSWTKIILSMYRVTHKGWDFIDGNYTVNVQSYSQSMSLHEQKLYC